MARHTGPVCKLCRREGEKLFLKGSRCMTPKCSFERRSYPHARKKPRSPGRRPFPVVCRPTVWVLDDALDRGLDFLLEPLGGSRVVASVPGKGLTVLDGRVWVEYDLSLPHAPSEPPASPLTKRSVPRAPSQCRATDERSPVPTPLRRQDRAHHRTSRAGVPRDEVAHRLVNGALLPVVSSCHHSYRHSSCTQRSGQLGDTALG